MASELMSSEELAVLACKIFKEIVCLLVKF